MGAKERKSFHKSETKKFEKALVSGMSDITDLIDDMKTAAETIFEDFQETRENLADSEGLLQTWEDNNGEKADAWDEVDFDIDLEFDDSEEDEEEAVERLYNDLLELWYSLEV